jgi:hypothetical protein
MSSLSYGVEQHKMQHGFILSDNDTFASHLVASGHHSRQTNLEGYLIIQGNKERTLYENRKTENNGESYFLFQAQNLDLPSLTKGAVMSGHIVESLNGTYSPENIIVKKASFVVTGVLLNIENPFFQSSNKIKEGYCTSKQNQHAFNGELDHSNLYASVNSGKCCIWNGRPYCGKPC